MKRTGQSFHRKTKAYVLGVILVGIVAVIASVYSLITDPIPQIHQWFLLAALTLISGSATVRLPSIPATISISEVFVFTSVLLFGTSAGTITVALDALVMSFWLAKKQNEIQRVLFNVSGTAAACWAGSQVFFWISGLLPLIEGTATLPEIVPGLMLFAIVYFLLNSWIITIAISLESGDSPLHIWRDNFIWLSLNYFFGASVAALLVVVTDSVDLTVLSVIVPLLLALYFTFRFLMARIEDANRHLSQVNAIHLSTIETLAMAIDAKDQITHGHIRRVQAYSVALARELGVTDEAQIRAIEAASLLHDLGKLAVPEYILNKPGALTAAEFEKMKLHASVGADILSSIDFPYPVVPIVRHHHEQWDGLGYPDGLKGSDIPIGARILAVVDCFDALTSDRPYRPRLSESEATQILRDRRTTMYDPLVVDAFLRIHRELLGRVLLPSRSGALHAIANAAQPPSTATGLSPYDNISASAEETLTLYDLAGGLAGQLCLSDTADVIAKHLRRIMPSSACVFYLYESDTDELLAAYATGEDSGAFTGIRVPLGQRLTGWVGANRQTIVNSDPLLDLGEVARSMKPRPRSCLSTPLVCDGNLVGVLTLYCTTENAYSEDHRRIVELVARQVSRAVRSSAEFERIRTNVLTDGLTGLPNVAHLRQFVEAEIRSEKGVGPSLAIVFIDIQGLRAINQTFGRDAGDAVLSRVAELTRRSLRGADILFRYGSDEFVVLLTQTDALTARAISERISSAIRSCSVALGGRTVDAAVSIAVAAAPADGAALDELVSVAKRRLVADGSRSSPQDSPRSVH
jgi:diguanylate cyclase (GGDEF)-like protein/putative nucleotidyltransferase with HDIG domain